MKKSISVLIKILIIVAGAAGIVVQATTVTNKIALFYFFTIQTNFICVLSYIMILWKKYDRRELHSKQLKVLSTYKFVLSVWVFILMLTYHFMIRPNSGYYQSLTGVSLVYDICLHYIVPVLVILDWVFYDKKDFLSWFSPFWTIPYPILYLVFVFIRAEVGEKFFNGTSMSKYPYFFLDVEKMGFTMVSMWSISLVSCFLVLGYLFIAIIKRIRKMQ